MKIGDKMYWIASHVSDRSIPEEILLKNDKDMDYGLVMLTLEGFVITDTIYFKFCGFPMSFSIPISELYLSLFTKQDIAENEYSNLINTGCCRPILSHPNEV